MCKEQSEQVKNQEPQENLENNLVNKQLKVKQVIVNGKVITNIDEGFKLDENAENINLDIIVED